MACWCTENCGAGEDENDRNRIRDRTGIDPTGIDGFNMIGNYVEIEQKSKY